MKKTDKIAIGMINDGKINSQLVIDLLHIAKLRPQFDSFIQVANIGLITRSRNVLIKNFLEQSDAQWLLMMDADERMDLQSFDALVNTANGERKVVSALVFAAFFEDNDQLRPVPTIYRDVENYGLQPIEDYPLNEIIQVDATGTGCLLIHRSVILELQEKATEHQGKDWAWFVDGPINGTWFGEDLLFSKRLKSLGISIYCNTSAILAHRKEFWLDNRHHTPFREYAIKNKAAE